MGCVARIPSRGTVPGCLRGGLDLRYLDANVFLFAVLDEGPRGERARGLLRRVVDGDEAAATCSLTVDEVVWILQKEGPRSVAIQEGQRLLSLPNLRILPVGGEEVLEAMLLMETCSGLDPRDAIHAAVAMGAGIYTVVSEDPDLQVVPELNHEGLEASGFE